MVVSTAHKITETLNSFTSKPNGIPGAVFRVVKKDGTLLYEGASGAKGLAHKDQPMVSDSLFYIASCTKLLTAVAALQLVEQGKLTLGDNAEKYVPEIAKIKILTGFDSDDKPIFQEPVTKITIQHLLLHTSGFIYELSHPLVKKYCELNIPHMFSTKRSSLDYPLVFEPGTSWAYGPSLDWLGLVIEKAAGQNLGAYMKQHIFVPLGMHSTTFVTNAELEARHAGLHFRVPDKTLTEIDHKIAQGDKVEVHLGGAGLHSSAVDYLTILFALLNEGEGSNRILKKESVDLLFTEHPTQLEKVLQIIPNPPGSELGFPSGIPAAWTFGGMKVDYELPARRSAGSIWWGGLTNCYWWIDRTKGVAGVFFAQILPPADAEVTACLAICEKLIYEGL